jgi:hypothetical protein
MSNQPPPPPVPPPAPASSLKGWIIGISIAVVVAVVIYLIVKGVSACDAKNDEATKKGPGALKCEQGDMGPVPKCGNWMCAKACDKSHNPTFTETPLNKDFCQGMNPLTKKLETLPKKFYDAK